MAYNKEEKREYDARRKKEARERERLAAEAARIPKPSVFGDPNAVLAAMQKVTRQRLMSI